MIWLFRIERDRVKFSRVSEFQITDLDFKSVSAVPETPAEPRPDPFEKAQEKAMELLENAVNEADAMMQQAKDVLTAAKSEAERLSEEARQQGFEHGYEEGRSEGEQLYQAMIAGNTEAFTNTLIDIKRAGDTMISDMEGEIIDLCFSVLRKITALDRATDAEIYKSIIKKAVSQVDLTGKVSVRLSHEDFDRFFPNGTAVFDINDTTVTTTVLSDPDFAAGDIAVDTDSETVLACAETQLRNIEIAFRHNIGRV